MLNDLFVIVMSKVGKVRKTVEIDYIARQILTILAILQLSISQTKYLDSTDGQVRS
jgi:hypothetical protein